MRDLLTLRRERVIEKLLGLDATNIVTKPLKYGTQLITVGIVVTPAAWYVDSAGIPALRGMNVTSGKISNSNLVHISREGHAAHRKSTLRQGDLVVVRTGQAGAAAVIPPELDGANCIDLVLVRPSPDMNSKYLEYILNSDWAKRRVEQYSVGSIQSHFNVSAMKQMPVPVFPLAQQREVTKQVDKEVSAMEQILASMERANILLAERRQALITAAVTGQIDVTTAGRAAAG
ncbi:hypothetical protein GCM10023224_08510 [Streptomonospora halophila]|uniref:Type I restriction modification DNA specificity domain-containing protein n=2 Tax=Streptomonospora halophila TaxID=427369 RepID=A0ABP9G7H6_9ACTN